MSLAEEPKSQAADAVELLLADCLEREPFERARALREACSTHPDLADDLRARWSALVAMGVLAGDERSDDADFPEQLGDFQLLERIGGGGMGVVYLARQSSLGREVALKLVRPEHLFFPRAKVRFRREAEAVARLAHPGIVPIYTVGEEQGIPFFAMERVRGCTLGEALERLQGRAPESLDGRDLHALVCAAAHVEPVLAPDSIFAQSWVELCLTLTRQVADALAHAHAQGVLHRDVKPSNIMLTPDGRAMLLDFGLAAATGVDGATRTGGQIGTLFYMSPEQVRAAEDVDARTDVYGLGVTLYELLTLQLPYRGVDAIETQRLILAGRPDSIRARNRVVPADVEIACNVALDVEPARRYANATAFARDLFNLLEHRPIAARPPSAWLRTRRWAQRRPALATAIVLGAALAIAVPSALYWQAQQHAQEATAHANELAKALNSEQAAHCDADRQRTAARDAETAANVARAQAEDEARTSDAALDFMIELFHTAAPQTRLGRDLSALELLENGADQIERELADRPAARARLQSGIGEVFFELGRYRQAQPLLESAYEILAAQGDERQALRTDRTMRFLAVTEERLHELERAEELARLAVERSREHEDEDPAGFVFACNHLAVVLGSRGQFDEARAVSEQLIDYLETHDVPDRRENLAANLSVLAQTLFVGGDLKGAVALCERALSIQRDVLPSVHPELHVTLAVLGYYRKAQRRLDDADACYSEAVCVMDALELDHGFDLANTLHNWAFVRVDQGDFDGALRLLDRAEEIDRRTFESSGMIRRMCAYGRGRVAVAAGRSEDALRAFKLAAPLFVERENLDELRVFGRIQLAIAHCARTLGRDEQALSAYRQAADVLSTIDDSHAEAGKACTARAEILERLGRADEAGEARTQASDVVR